MLMRKDAGRGGPRSPVQIDLALQGGGSHGAFTWGVLDRLLEEPWLKIEAISGTSAGAMNGAVLVSGYMEGGPEGARAALDAYWGRVADAARFSPIQRSPLDRLLNRWSLDTSPGYLMMDLMSRVVSPYSLNPFGHNPISDILEKSIDFAHLGEASIKLFITATNILAALTGSASGGLTIALDALGGTYLQRAAEIGMDPALLHRVAVIGSGTLDSLPHNGAVVTLLAVCGTSHKDSYKDIFIVAIGGALVALAVVIVLGTLVGSF